METEINELEKEAAAISQRVEALLAEVVGPCTAIATQETLVKELSVVTEASIKQAKEVQDKVIQLSSELNDLDIIKKNLNKLEQNVYRYEKIAQGLLVQRKKK